MAASWTAKKPRQRRWQAAISNRLTDEISDREKRFWCDLRNNLIQVLAASFPAVFHAHEKALPQAKAALWTTTLDPWPLVIRGGGLL